MPELQMPTSAEERKPNASAAAAPNFAQSAIALAKQLGGDLKNAIKSFGSAWILEFLYYSMWEIFPGGLYAVPLLDLYLVIGFFKKDNPKWHYFSKIRTISIVAFSIVYWFMVLVVIMAFAYSVCNGLFSSWGIKIGSLFSDSLGQVNEMCKLVR